MPCHPEIHHRRSVRLQGYDYSQAGLYFVTICVQNRECLFGNVSDGKMILNETGQIAYNEWVNLSERYPHVLFGVFQIMPNHVHGIIEVSQNAVGATLAVALNDAATINRAVTINRATARVAPTVVSAHINHW
jgi:REP element-mobilizing transposase RayT